MAIKVTGFFQNPQTNIIYDSPLLTLVPHLEYPGKINMDVKVESNKTILGSVGYVDINKSVIPYPSASVDPYSDLITALETYVINNLKNANTINSQSLFEVYTT